MVRQLYIPGVRNGIAIEEDGSDAVYIPNVGAYGEDLLSSGTSLARDCAFALSLQATNAVDVTQWFNNTAERTRENLHELDWLGTVTAKSSNSVQVLSGMISPNELAGERRSELVSPNKVSLENSESWADKNSFEVERLSGWRGDLKLPVSLSIVRSSSQTLTFSWLGALEVRSDHKWPIGWRGGNLFSTNFRVTAIWGNASIVAVDLPITSLAIGDLSSDLGVSSFAIATASPFYDLKWDADTGFDLRLPMSWRLVAVLSSHQVHPIEWGGVSGFVTGNIRLFTSEPRDGPLSNRDRATSFRTKVRGVGL